MITTIYCTMLNMSEPIMNYNTIYYKLANYINKLLYDQYLDVSSAVVAEWLRRWTWNPMGFPRAGSNPAGCEIILICFLTFYITLFFRVSNRKQKISLDCPDYAKTNTWYRHKNKSPSPPKSEPNRGSQKRYFIVSIAIIAYTHMHMSSKIKIIMYKIGPLR